MQIVSKPATLINKISWDIMRYKWKCRQIFDNFPNNHKLGHVRISTSRLNLISYWNELVKSLKPRDGTLSGTLEMYILTFVMLNCSMKIWNIYAFSTISPHNWNPSSTKTRTHGASRTCTICWKRKRRGYRRESECNWFVTKHDRCRANWIMKLSAWGVALLKSCWGRSHSTRSHGIGPVLPQTSGFSARRVEWFNIHDYSDTVALYVFINILQHVTYTTQVISLPHPQCLHFNMRDIG